MLGAGRYIPPLLIFRRTRENLELLKGSPPATKRVFHPSGRMNMEIFCPTGFEDFVRHTSASA